jgi:FtsP/CotA-like multicopper oxidase with cupredoxin domain
MGSRLRSKKMAPRDLSILVIRGANLRANPNPEAELASGFGTPKRRVRNDKGVLDITSGKWSASSMTSRVFPLSRRRLLTGLGAVALGRTIAPLAAQSLSSLALQAAPGTLALRLGEPPTPIWSLATPTRDGQLRFRRGDQVQVAFGNDLPGPVVLNWHGIDGIAAAEPLAARSPVAAAGKDSFALPLRHAGTFIIDLRLLGDSQPRPSPARGLIVEESEPAAVDRDEMVLIEDWRLRRDGGAVAPGVAAQDTISLFTVNGQTSTDIPARTHQRIRFRFINACQRNGIAIKIEDHDIRVMAIDSQPSEPFLARNGQLVLAPGTRIDAFVDAVRPPGSTSSILLHDGTAPRSIGRLVYSAEVPVRDTPSSAPAPLPSNGLPAQLDLKNALRIDMALGSAADWVIPTAFATGSPPAFRAKAGRTVVLALTNRASMPNVFHLHGHHFRLLDRLDDGWKPFWLDTLAINAGQTQRIAFAAGHVGRWLIESFATDWAAPRLVRWYSVE